MGLGKYAVKALNWLETRLKKDEKPRIIKMYVLVRTDMPPIHRAVQAGHAVAEYFMKFRSTTINDPKEGLVKWGNGYMIYLGVKDEAELHEYELKLRLKNVEYATFFEPDWGVNPQGTALACISFGEEFESLPLLNMEESHIE